MKNSIIALSLVGGLLAVATQNAVPDPFAELDSATSAPSSAPGAQSSSSSEMSEFEKFKQQHLGEFKSYKQQLMEEFNEFKKISQVESERYQKELGTVWDKPELSTKKTWVTYSEDKQTKNKVDFEKQTITISTQVGKDKKLADEALRKKLRALIMQNQAQAFKEDKVAQAVEKKSKEKLKLIKTSEVRPTPIVLPLVTDDPKPSPKKVDKIVDDLLKGKKETVEKSAKKTNKVVTVEIPIPPVKEEPIKKQPVKKAPTKTAEVKPVEKTSPKAKVMADQRFNKLPRKAREISNPVAEFAKKANVDIELVYAIIETESAFNPMAKSPIPAFGLMQIVPGSAGMDATQKLFGKGRILSPSYLYDRDQNIEVGTTYLNILYFSYLKGVKDPLSRLYCVIAAYNTGAGNVSKAFIGTKKLRNALPVINSKSPQQVYDHMIKNLPYEETQNYLKKVVTRMPKYKA